MRQQCRVALRLTLSASTLAALLSGCAIAAVTPADPRSVHLPEPVDVRVVSAANNGSDFGLVLATWALVGITAALCIVTWRSSRTSLKEAARFRREVLDREVNAAAHRAAATAEHVGQLAASVVRVNSRVRSSSSTAPTALPDDPLKIVADQRISRTEEIKNYALGLVSLERRDKTDDQLTAAQRRLDEHLTQLEVLKEAIAGELAELGRQIDSEERQAATVREERRQLERRVNSEVGQCNKLIFILGQMLSSLGDFQQILFDDKRKELGREPKWDEIGALVGAPTSGPEFIIGEYAFLLEGDAPSDLAPAMLGRIYTAEANYRQILARVNERTQLWQQYLEYRGVPVGRGEAAITNMASVGALTARIKELTKWLAEDLPEWIQTFKALFPALDKVLTARYPGKRFIKLWPNDTPGSGPL